MSDSSVLVGSLVQQNVVALMWPDLYPGEENGTTNNSMDSVPFDHIRSFC